MHHDFDRAKLFISNTCCCLRPTTRTSRALQMHAWSRALVYRRQRVFKINNLPLAKTWCILLFIVTTKFYQYSSFQLILPNSNYYLKSISTIPNEIFILPLFLCLQMISRIEYVHMKNFIHRDIKPDNFLMGIGRHCNQVQYICAYVKSSWVYYSVYLWQCGGWVDGSWSDHIPTYMCVLCYVSMMLCFLCLCMYLFFVYNLYQAFDFSRFFLISGKK